MAVCYTLHDNTLRSVPPAEARQQRDALLWVDLLNPTSEEEHEVESMLGVSIPTRDEMHEIELSNRLYEEGGSYFATATLVTQADTLVPESHAITFVMTPRTLVTVRYCDPASFKAMHVRMPRLTRHSAPVALTELLEAIVNRAADVLENAGRQIDAMAQAAFRSATHASGGPVARPDYGLVLQQIGGKGDLISKCRESLVSLSRLVSFYLHSPPFAQAPSEHERLASVARDIAALSDHASFLSSNVNFLLDATLGMVNLEQNAIIKIVSVATLVFLPPTLVASIYGMNFVHMPELQWMAGYPMALVMMSLAGYLPYRFFRNKGWL